MRQPPPDLARLKPWIISKHRALGWNSKGEWLGPNVLKALLIADADKPQGVDALAVKQVVNYLMSQGLVGPAAVPRNNNPQQPAPGPSTTTPQQQQPQQPPPPPPRAPPGGAQGKPQEKAEQGGRRPRAAKKAETKTNAKQNAPKGSTSQTGTAPSPKPSTGNIPTGRASRGFSNTFSSSMQESQWSTPQPEAPSRVTPIPPPTPKPTTAPPPRVHIGQGITSQGSNGRGTPTSQTAPSTPFHNNTPTFRYPPLNANEEAPTLEDQFDLLGVDQSDDEERGNRGFSDGDIKEAMIFSAPLITGEDADRVKQLIPQYGLIGSTVGTKEQDTRVFLNSNNPGSFFICGLQGSGKSHTLSSLLENYLIPTRKLGILQRPLSCLVLHFGEFNSRSAFRPCEAAYLACPNRAFPSSAPHVESVTVLVSPSNYHNLRAAYSEIENVTVRQLKLQSGDLTIQSMLTLMSVDSSSSQPLYMAQVTKVLRDMAAIGGDFDYTQFKSRLEEVDLTPIQRRMLDQRLELLESFLDLENFEGGCFDGIASYASHFEEGQGNPQQLTIVDLSCPFVDAGAACVLFNICIGLFLSACKAEELGKVIAVDEAHKYMTDTPASKLLTEQLLSIIRQQRHYAARVIIATQEPTISPRLMALASGTIIHRFNSPEWFNTLRRHLSIVGEGGKDAEELFERIVSLKQGEALVFCQSAIIWSESNDMQLSSGNWNGSIIDDDDGVSTGGDKITLREMSTVDANSPANINDDWNATDNSKTPGNTNATGEGDGDGGVWVGLSEWEKTMQSKSPKTPLWPQQRVTSGLKKMSSGPFKIKIRKRITADGGATIRSV